VNSILKKIGILSAIFLVVVLALSTIPITHAYTGIVYGDLSDGNVNSIPSSNDGDNRIFVGDAFGSNEYIQGFVKFSLSGITSVDSATLYIYVGVSWRNNVLDNTSPLTNPGLGDCVVRHIADYGTIGDEDLDAPSIGNDPGVLIGGAETPNKGYVSIDVTAAMQDDIANGRPFSTFMIRITTNTDGDGRNDLWTFLSANNAGTDLDPYIEYSISLHSSVVGGVQIPVNSLMVLLPYFALLGSVCVIFVTLVIRKKQ
jgi:hypothetical protein